MTPDGWILEKMGDITSWRSGGTPPMRNSSFWSGDIPWISASTMHGNAFNTSTKFISEEGLKAGSKLADPNDLLLLVRGSMLWNRIPIGIAKRHLAFNQDVKSITASSSLLPNFLLFWFLANENKLLHMVTGTGIGAGKLDTKELQAIRIEVPTLPEQKKIAQILSTWDKAIETVEKLIANSQQKKKALMQQLLTGKKRFPGFDGEWKEVRLGEITNIDSGFAFKNTEFISNSKGSVPIIKMSNLKCGRLQLLDATRVSFATVKELGRFELHAGDFIFGMSGSLTNYAKVENKDLPCFLNQRVGRIRAKESTHQSFISYLYLSPKVQQHILDMAAGAAQLNISTSELRKIKVVIPAYKEQQKIASALSSADQEIETWQKQLEHLKQEKKALMQQLLTGKKRVVIDA